MATGTRSALGEAMKTLLQNFQSGLAKFFDEFSKDNTFSMAAALAFYAALSIAPLLILFLTLAAQFNFSVQSSFVQEVDKLMGDKAAEVIEMIIEAAKNREDLKGLSGFFGIITLAISSSAVFVELKSSLNRILDSELSSSSEASYFHIAKTFIKDRILNIGFAISFLFILLISLILSTLINIYLAETGQWMAQAVNWVTSFSIQFCLFTLLYRYVPDRHENWRRSCLSGVITTFLFIIGKEVVGYYLGNSGVASAYGAAGSVIVLLIWIYYTSLIVFSGAQISHLVMSSPKDRK